MTPTPGRQHVSRKPTDRSTGSASPPEKKEKTQPDRDLDPTDVPVKLTSDFKSISAQAVTRQATYMGTGEVDVF